MAQGYHRVLFVTVHRRQVGVNSVSLPLRKICYASTLFPRRDEMRTLVSPGKFFRGRWGKGIKMAHYWDTVYVQVRDLTCFLFPRVLTNSWRLFDWMVFERC